MRLAIGLSLLALASPLVSCSQDPRRRRAVGFSDAPVVPIGQSDIPRAGKITYRHVELEHKENGKAYLDIEIDNGTARGFRSCTVIVTFLGRDGAKKRVRYGLGPLFEGANERVVIRSTVEFAIEDVQVAVQTLM